MPHPRPPARPELSDPLGRIVSEGQVRVSDVDVIQSHLEVLMAQHLETDELLVDCDGDIAVQDERARYVARVKKYGHNVPHIEVYSIVVRGVDADPGLYEALNDWNRRLSHSRAFWTDRKVVVAGELVGEAAGLADLVCLCSEIAGMAGGEGPKIAATFGGQLSCPDEEDQ